MNEGDITDYDSHYFYHVYLENCHNNYERIENDGCGLGYRDYGGNNGCNYHPALHYAAAW